MIDGLGLRERKMEIGRETPTRSVVNGGSGSGSTSLADWAWASLITFTINA